jgi:hypothetical protein
MFHLKKQISSIQNVSKPVDEISQITQQLAIVFHHQIIPAKCSILLTRNKRVPVGLISDAVSSQL